MAGKPGVEPSPERAAAERDDLNQDDLNQKDSRQNRIGDECNGKAVPPVEAEIERRSRFGSAPPLLN